VSLNNVVNTFRVPYTVTVTRRVPASLVDGVAVPDPAPTVFVINDTEDSAVSIVPSTGQVTNADVEGQSSSNERIMFSKVELRARNPAGPGDLLALADGTYEVVKVNDWTGLRGDGTQNCWECVAAKQETP
jgi:hypothetical protein